MLVKDNAKMNLLKLDAKIIRVIQCIVEEIGDNKEERELMRREYLDQAISGDYACMIDYLRYVQHRDADILESMLKERIELKGRI